MYKHIVRELYPNGMPMLIQGELHRGEFEEGPVVDSYTCKMYPVIGNTVLPASPSLDANSQHKIALRLTDLIRKN